MNILRKILKTFCLLAALFVTSQTAFAEAVGTWQIYPSYSSIEDIEVAGNDIFVKASSNLYSYNTSDGSLQVYDKTNFLTDINVKFISWNSSQKRLVVAYDDSNIDLLSANGDVVNISDIYLKQMTGNKTINSVINEGRFAYVATGFGIVKIDVAKGYIADSYILNNEIKHVAVIGDYIYALRNETDRGVYKANMKDNLNDPASWKLLTDVFFQYMFSLNGKLIGMTDGNANTIDTETGEVVAFGLFAFSWAKKTGDRILCGKSGKVNEITSDLTCRSFSASHNISVVCYGKDSNSYWANNAENQLVKYSADGSQMSPLSTGVMPNGPADNHSYRLWIDNETLYSINGFYTIDSSSFWNGQVSFFKDGMWDMFRDDVAKITKRRYRDISCISVSPIDPRIVMIGGETGLYKFVDGKFEQVYDSGNSPLASGVPTSSEPRNWSTVLSMVHDKSGNLWVANGSNPNIICLKSNGEWDVFEHGDLLSGNYRISLQGALIDQRNYLWFCSSRWEDSRVFCYDIKNDRLKRYDDFINQDNTRYQPYMRNMAADRRGNIWIASNKGPFYIKSEDIADGREVMTQHKVPRNDGTNFADYLLSDIDILCITVDAANRKWFGTNGMGVFVISDDCNIQEHHFTTGNSPLSSDVVTDIKIDSNTGRVFFSTDKGICSYMSGISESNPDMIDSNVWAYPNPVTPDYTGYITVKGLENGCSVIITSASGQKVAEGMSIGGSYIWNGCDQNGNRVASGVYMVLVANPDGGSGVATKIAIVR